MLSRLAWRREILARPGNYVTGARHNIYESGMPRGVSSAPETEARIIAECYG
jgi:hypothetical protein